MSRGYYSKSMFNSSIMEFGTKSMFNPVSGVYGKSVTGSYIGGGDSNVSVTAVELDSLRVIQSLYTANLASKDYQNIPVDFTKYLKLRNIANNAVTKYKQNSTLSLLFKITVDGITGAINTYGLNTLNTETQVQNMYLQGVLQDIVNGVNNTKAFDENTGTLSMMQDFYLAPLFRYYIGLYGVPEPGAGFDPVKLSLVLTALENSGIDPYN